MDRPRGHYAKWNKSVSLRERQTLYDLVCVCVCVCVCACTHTCASSVVSNSLQPYKLKPISLCPWNSPGTNTRVGCHFLLWGIFLTQGWKLSLASLASAGVYSLSLSHLGSPYDLMWESEKVKLIETESQLVVIKDWEEGKLRDTSQRIQTSSFYEQFVLAI